jgi:PAS domain S-box-containing protein
MAKNNWDASGADRRAPTASSSEMLLDFAVSHAPTIFYVASLEGDRPLIFMSSNVFKILGITQADFMSDNTYGRRLIHPDDLGDYILAIDDLPSKKNISLEYRFRHANGDYRWFRDEQRYVGEGDKKEFVGCMIDITGQKQAEERVSDAEALTTTITESTLDALITTESDGEILDFNPTAEKMFGYSRDEAIGRNLAKLIIPGEHQAAHLKGLADFSKSGHLRDYDRRIEVDGMHADGSPVPVELTLSHASLRGRDVLIGSIRDISERISAEEEQQRLSRLLRDAVDSLPHGFAITGKDGSLVLGNRAFASTYGKTPDEMIGVSLKNHMPTFIKLLNSFDGKTITGSAKDRKMVEERLQHSHDNPVEANYKDGRWLLFSRTDISDGAFVTLRTDITIQKNAEAERARLSRLLHEAVESLPHGFSILDSDGSVVVANSAYAKSYGRTADNSIGISQADYMDPFIELCHRFDGREITVCAEDKTYIEERMLTSPEDPVEVETKTGAVWLMVRTHLSDGGYVTLRTDITTQKKAEAERQRLAQLLHDAVESLPHGFLIMNKDSVIQAANSAFASSYGRSAKEMIGINQDDTTVPFIELCHSFDGRKVTNCSEDISFIKGRMLTSREVPIEAEMKDGTWWLIIQTNTSDGGFATLRTDITRQKKAETAIMESSDMIRRILEACPRPVVMTRLSDGLVNYESPASKELYARENVKGDVYSSDIYTNPSDRSLYVKQLKKFGSVDGMELKLRRMDGSEFWASVSARKIEFQGVECIVASAWDMTESLALEGELTRQREALHQSEKLSALGELLAGVAHELNNPLSVLVGQALLLQETTTDENIMSRAKKIGNAADRCARIVKTFLAMARQQPVNRRNTEINDVIESALEMTSYGVEDAGIKMTTRMAQNLPSVWVDPDQINQVITNLVVNAQHALEGVEGKRQIHVSSSYRAKDNEVVIKVSDTGPGIPPDVQARIFEPFYTTKEVGVGTGIGLAFCHRIMEFHGGRIKVDSTAGSGTAFVVRIPAETPCAANFPFDTSYEQGHNQLNILVVDDEQEVTEILSEILSKDGHRVVTAENGNRALTYLSNDNFDVILSDMRMPELDGPNFYRVLGERFPEMTNRVAFITGDTMSPKIAGFLSTCGCPSLEKPITPMDVRGIVDEIANAPSKI